MKVSSLETGGAEARRIDALRAWRRALVAHGAALDERRVAQQVAVAAACAAAAMARDAAAAVQAESRAVRDTVRARPGRVEAHEAPRPIRVLVVDDLALLRRMLVRQLTHAGHAVVGEAATAAEAVARVHALRPDVVVLDVQLPDGLGTAVAAHLAAGRPTGDGAPPPDAPRPAVVFYTGDVAGALAAGAGCVATCGGPWAVLEKPAPAAALDRAVRDAVARGRRVA